jgi:hypothetical protein
LRGGYEWLAIALEALRGIEPHEVLQALGAERRWPRLAHSPGGQPVLPIWARTSAGRGLIVAVRALSEWQWQIVGVRAMQPEELITFEKWEAGQ